MAKDHSDRGFIGRAMRRREDDALLRGQGRFTDDLVPQGALHMVVVRAPVASSRLVAVDLDEARAAPCVVAVYAADDLGEMPAASVNPLIEGAPIRPMVVLARERVAAVGQPVAVVLAESRAAAEQAAELVMIETENDDPTNESHRVSAWQHGQPGAAATRVSLSLAHPRLAPFAMEPRAALALPKGDGLTVYLSTQTPHRAREDLQRMLGLAPGALRVVAPDVGGAFGGKASIYPEDVLCAFAARRLGRAVSWRASRGEDFLSATHGRGASSRAEMALDGEGRITWLKARHEFTMGYWMPYSAYAPVSNAGRILPGPYHAAALDIAVDVRITDAPAVNIYRGAGRPEAAMLMERTMDKAAREAGLDPFEIRRRNIIRAFPHDTPTGERLDSGDYAALLDRLEAASDYAALRARQAERRAAGEVVGLGLALYIEPCGRGWESAKLTLLPDGRVQALTGASAQGQGRETAFAQLLADELSTDPARITVGEGDSAALDQGIGALASRSTAIGASAMQAAAQALREKVQGLLGGNEFPGREAAVEALADHLPLTVEETYTAPGEAWASGAVLAQVAVDRDTGALTVEGITWVDDAGRVLNPLLVEGQLWGGMAQGLGAALMERLVIDEDGQMLTGSLMDYAVPRAADMPGRVVLGKIATQTAANAFGAKGVGEAGCIGVPAAILNAAQDALAPFTERDLALPLTSERLWRAMNDLEDQP